RKGERNVQRGAVFTQADGFEMFNPGAPPDLLDNLRLLVQPVRRNQNGAGLAYRFLSRVAEHPLRALVPTSDDAIEVFAQDRVVRGTYYSAQQSSHLLPLLPLGDVEEHVNAANDSAFGIAQRRRIRFEPNALAVWPFGDGFLPADGPALLKRDSHRTFVVRHRRAVGIVELPAYAPLVGSQLWSAPGEFDGGRVETREAAFGVGRVDRRWDRVYYFAEAALAFALGHLRFAARAMKLQMRLHAREQFAGAEGLDQIIVRPGFHPLDARLFARASRKQNDWDGLQPLVGAQFAQQPEAVKIRHHHVGQHEVGRALTNRIQRRFSVGNGFNFVLPAEQPPQVIAHVGVVVGQQNSGIGRRGDGATGQDQVFNLILIAFRGACRPVALSPRRPVFFNEPPQRLFDVTFATQRRRGERARGPDALGGQMSLAQRDHHGELAAS